MKGGSKGETVYLAVDVNNLWHSCRDLHGEDARVNWRAFLKRVKAAGYRGVPRKVTAVAYTIAVPRRIVKNGKTIEQPPQNERFLKTLERFGFTVKVRMLRYSKESNKPFHSDWDVGIAVDAMARKDHFSTFVLASGDGDYIPLIRKLQKQGKRVEVYTFEKTASQHLFGAADHIHYVTEDMLFIEKVNGSRSNDKENSSKG